MSNVISISILKFFAQLNDPRQTAKVLYPLPEIILVALCAAICGADSFVEMEEFGNAKLVFLRNILPYAEKPARQEKYEGTQETGGLGRSVPL